MVEVFPKTIARRVASDIASPIEDCAVESPATLARRSIFREIPGMSEQSDTNPPSNWNPPYSDRLPAQPPRSLAPSLYATGFKGVNMTRDETKALQHVAFNARDLGLDGDQIIEAEKAPASEYQIGLDARSHQPRNQLTRARLTTSRCLGLIFLVVICIFPSRPCALAFIAYTATSAAPISVSIFSPSLG